MDYLTTNFNTELIDVNFTGPFRLMSLPLEIIIKILVFLDIPDLTNLSNTCVLLKKLANDKFISSSRFFYTRDKIGISIQQRPSIDWLYTRNIMPTKSPVFNPNQFLIVSMLTKSIVKDNLKKRLQRRPSLQELQEKNIFKKEANEFVKSKIKEFKKQNLANILTVYVKSYKFQKSTSVPSNNEETPSIISKFYTNLKKVTPNRLKKAKSHETIPVTTASKFLNHFEKSSSRDSARSVSLDSKVLSKKEYFENLISNETNKEVKPINNRKPSRTLLKASIINDCAINYEKVY